MAKPPIDAEYAFDPMDPAQAKDFERLARIRRERPVCRPAEGIVLTTRHADTRQAFLDAKRFSSVGDMRAPGVVVPVEESFLGELDAPLHPRIRRILLKGFTRSRASAAEAWTRASVRRRLDGLARQGGGDLMQALAIPLPGSVSAHVLGIPDALHDPVMRWCDELLHSTWPSPQSGGAVSRTWKCSYSCVCAPEASSALSHSHVPASLPRSPPIARHE